MSFKRTVVNIPSVEQGINLHAWYYRPDTPGPHPVVVAGHGLTVIKEAGFAAFGERWASDANYASIIFDYRGFGDSDGRERNVVTLKGQVEDYKSVISWIGQHEENFRLDKIVAMGSASSGMYVADLVVNDGRLAGGMAHCPLLDGKNTLMALPFNPRLVFWAIVDTARNALGLSPIFVKSVGQPNEFAFMNTPTSHSGFTNMFSQGKTPFTEAPNLIAPRYALDLMFNGDAGNHLTNARCPMLVVMAEADDLIPAKLTKSIVEKSNGRAKLVSVPCGHFDIMKGGSGFDANINAQLEFLKELL